ncbi:MAG: hypothetical protein KME30_28315 [Iphinoe sp. HA4291-MV1]|jgi:UDP:flavonoid glycosyltransferase YjiC (YdhE family)|nr:hypothetical protein [Iphinoe sp. HA4291-MV1]
MMKKHIMFVSLPLLGHANQMIALAQELVCRGYQVSFAIAEEAREWIANTNAHFISWEPRLQKTDAEIHDNKKDVWQRSSQEPSIWRGDKFRNKQSSLIQPFVPLLVTVAQMALMRLCIGTNRF